MNVLSVLSAAGRERGMLETLHVLDYTGGAVSFDGPKVVFYVGEGTPPELPDGWELVRFDRPPRGCTLDMMAALDWTRDEWEPERLLYFEDDVFPVTNAVPFMESVELSPRWAFLSCYDCAGFGGLIPSIFEVEANAPGTQYGHTNNGNQALVIPGRTLRHIVGQSIAPGPFVADTHLGWMATSPPNPPRFAMVSPSLVEHVGGRSVANVGLGLKQPGRHSVNFPGADWDVLGPEAKFQRLQLVES
jgi:hypothetical protein